MCEIEREIGRSSKQSKGIWGRLSDEPMPPVRVIAKFVVFLYFMSKRFAVRKPPSQCLSLPFLV